MYAFQPPFNPTYQSNYQLMRFETSILPYLPIQPVFKGFYKILTHILYTTAFSCLLRETASKIRCIPQDERWFEMEIKRGKNLPNTSRSNGRGVGSWIEKGDRILFAPATGGDFFSHWHTRSWDTLDKMAAKYFSSSTVFYYAQESI